MMVDNTIDGDGRVQKAARAMADAGYEVTLLGKAPGDEADTWHLGDAVVRRVPVDLALERAQRRRLYRARKLARILTGTLRRGPAATGGPGTPGMPGAPAAPRSIDDTVLDGLRARCWKALRGNGCWTALAPSLLDQERAYLPVVDELAPQIIHGHDYKMVGVAVRAARRLRARGHDVRVVFDSHEFLPGVGGPTLRWRIAHEAYEAAHISAADAVVAVSPEMAARIAGHHRLPVLPSVVMNAPPAQGSATGSGDVRSTIGLGDDVPLLVYIGVSAAKRGLGPVVEALPQLPGVHLALVTRRNEYVDGLEKTAAGLGVADRLHVLGYVPVEDVVPFVSTASAGVQSMVHVENYDVTVATKYFDYARARLPVIQSDVRAMAAMTREVGNGEVFVAQDRDSFAAAARAVLADLPRYRAAYDRPGLLDDWTWERQAEVLAEVYRRVLATPVGTPVPPVPTVGR
jgi:glycosyltransferase involved in cell wall biosynthesis